MSKPTKGKRLLLGSISRVRWHKKLETASSRPIGGSETAAFQVDVKRVRNLLRGE
jgi:hypothetical protein